MAPALGLCGAGLASALAAAALFPDQVVDWAIEGGPVETFTVVAYGACALIAVRHLRGSGAVAGLVMMLAVLMALREIDAHAAFTRYGVFSLRLYARPDVPLPEKLAAASALLLLGGLLAWRLRRAWPRLTAPGGRAGLTLGVTMGFAAALKQLDALPRQLTGFGVTLDSSTLALAKAVEEVGEVFLPALLLLVLAQGRAGAPRQACRGLATGTAERG